MSLPLAVVVAPWVSSWLTPVWLISAGVGLGLVVLLLLWGIGAALSCIPGLGTLGEKRGKSAKVSAAVAAVLMIAALVYLGLRISGIYQDEGWTGISQFLLPTLLGLIPLALLLWFGVYCFFALVQKRTVAEAPAAIGEGILWPLLWVFLALGLFGLAGVVVLQRPWEMAESLLRIPATGITGVRHEIAAPPAAGDSPQEAIAVDFYSHELTNLTIVSDVPLELTFEEAEANDKSVFRLPIPANEAFVWNRPVEGTPLAEEHTRKIYVRNLGDSAGEVRLTLRTAPKHPEAAAIPVAALVVVLLFLAYLLQRSLAPRLSAVALATTKSEIAQPLFLILMCIGIFLLVLFIWIPYNTFGEDIKMLKDSSLTLILVLCIIQAVWAASSSLADEIDGRTALTVLSKPIGRRDFILGKFLGISWAVVLLFLVLSIVFLIVVAYKPIYDARETSNEDPTWQVCFVEMATVTPGLVLALLEALVLASISVAISTRLPLLANFVICSTIYVLGHLTPMIVQSSSTNFEVVLFFGKLIALVFPVLDHFNIQAAIAGGAEVPLAYLGWSLMYSLLYGGMSLLLALMLFEDRDLA